MPGEVGQRILCSGDCVLCMTAEGEEKVFHFPCFVVADENKFIVLGHVLAFRKLVQTPSTLEMRCAAACLFWSGTMNKGVILLNPS